MGELRDRNKVNAMQLFNELLSKIKEVQIFFKLLLFDSPHSHRYCGRHPCSFSLHPLLQYRL